jgi:prepilin-type N-terminal cleavage/methylation domain-containing protein
MRRCCRRGGGRSERCPTDEGFTLIEAVVALTLFAVVFASLLPLLTMGARQVDGGRRRSVALWLAESKLAQLRSLTWGVRFVEGIAVYQQDEVTDLSWEAARESGGGTRASPERVMERAVAGYVDYLDERGRWIERGAAAEGEAPAGAAYERRWAVVRMGSDASELLLFHVAVAVLVELRGVQVSDWRRDPRVVWVSGARLRRAR